MITVNVEYCGSCGYKPRFDELEKQVKEAYPDVTIFGSSAGRIGSFEIYIEDQIIFSKLEKGSFPDFNEVVEVVKMAIEKGEVVPVEGTQPGNCNIL